LFPVKEIARRVSFAEELHKNKQLSDMIQRQLMEGRDEDIADYLEHQEQRFFNSLVVAVYKGRPSWHEIGDISSNVPGLSMERIPEEALSSFGLLQLTGQERLFAIDGQHRLAGIKEAVKRGVDLTDEDCSVLLVAHQDTPAGFERTRRLFTTLNKRAIPVTKADIIALDEDDVMAITSRRLVESHPFFSGDRIAVLPTPNLPPSDASHLTTIGNLYDVLEIVFSRIMAKQDPAELKRCRPSDDKLDKFYHFAVSFFECLCVHFRPLGEFFQAADFAKVVRARRSASGGNIMFRPIGLRVVTEVVAELLPHQSSMEKCIEAVSVLPQDLGQCPYRDVLWDPKKRRMDNQGRALARDLLLFMLDVFPRGKIKGLQHRYARALGREPEDGRALLQVVRGK
jgi:DNA sulfur modification protein DndB